jgi:AraC family transcriptional regulator of adaptative response / DNA-3-methyladenine glycosylase II
MLDDDACWRALRARDARFDGRFFVGVSSTGIYCRPICPARTPRRDRCSFHTSAAAAEQAGFRACLRCRPELAPGSASIDALPRLVARALALIGEGYLDEHSVDDLAARLGVGARHLRRTLEAELGVTPIELAQTRRLALAKQLLHDSSLSLTTIAYASGFGSLRRFNASFRARFARSPSTLRRELSTRRAGTNIRLRLDARPPLDVASTLAFLGARAIPGIEWVEDDRWVRRVGEHELRVAALPGKHAIVVELDVELAPQLARIVAKLRRVFDLDAEPRAIASQLRRDARLAPLVRARPGLRVPGSFEPWETALRTILGQQVTIAAATTLMRRLVGHFEGMPTPQRLAACSVETIAALGMPGARARSLVGLAAAWQRGVILCEPGDDPLVLRERLLALPGIGPWTAEYLAMRALHDPDALPSSDLVLRKALDDVSPRALERRAEAWRPFRSYAVLHLWSAS